MCLALFLGYFSEAGEAIRKGEETLNSASDSCGGLACDMTAIPPDERSNHVSRIRWLFGERASSQHEISDGFSFEFRRGGLEEVLRVIAEEQKCCPFLAVSLKVDPHKVPVHLAITSAEGGGAIIEADLLGYGS